MGEHDGTSPVVPPGPPRSARAGGDDGTALVEFALVFPILFALILGMVSAGIAWNQRMQLTHGAREGARYGAIVHPDQAFTNGQTWGRNVLDVMIDRAGTDLRVDGAVACIALVHGSPGVAYGADYVARATRSGGAWTYDRHGGQPCIAAQTYPVSSGDTGLRVQATVSRPGRFEALFHAQDLTLTALATSKSEGTR